MASNQLLRNITEGLGYPDGVIKETVKRVQGDYEYWYYGCDGVDDRGWGCGYRTLQTLCSWVMLKQKASGKLSRNVPSIKEIQESLVAMQDKSQQFIGSRQWIGSVEVALCVDYFYDVPCKIIHSGTGTELQKHVNSLENHFETCGAPVMMGGDTDNASKGIFGVCRTNKEAFFLILDPHYFGAVPTRSVLENKQFLLWRPVKSFMEDSFYNMCLPQYKV